MNRVNAELRISETSLLRRENGLLWVLVAVLLSFLMYSESRVERIKAQVNPQAVMDACTRSIK
jgi:hypothetical protein